MKFPFEDPSFSFETLRAIGYAPYGGADIGEVVSTAYRIPEGDEVAWHQQWKAWPRASRPPPTSARQPAARRPPFRRPSHAPAAAARL